MTQIRSALGTGEGCELQAKDTVFLQLFCLSHYSPQVILFLEENYSSNQALSWVSVALSSGSVNRTTYIWVFPYGKVSKLCVIKSGDSLTPHIPASQIARLMRSWWKTELIQQLSFSLRQEDGYGEAIILTPFTLTILSLSFSDLHWHSSSIHTVGEIIPQHQY